VTLQPIADRPTVRRSRTLERWLRGLIAAYQDESIRPRDQVFSNLEDLGPPTQLLAVAVRDRSVHRCAILVLHCADQRNGRALSAVCESLAELADFSSGADAYFGTADLPRQEHPEIDIIMPAQGVAAGACIALGSLIRQGQGAERGSFRAHSRSRVDLIPPGAEWAATFAFPLPRPEDVLRALGQSPPPPRSEQPAPPPARPPEPAFIGFAAATEPHLWFGPLPVPTARDLLRNPHFRSWPARRVIANRLVGDTEVIAYNDGLFFARTLDREKALTVLNLVFASLSISGVTSLLAVPDFELVTVNQFDESTQAIQGSGSVVTPRNELVSPILLNQLSRPLLSLPEEALPPALEVASALAADKKQSALALRLLSARTLFWREHFTEAFVMAWTLIETALGRKFEDFWIESGRGRTRVRDMERDWTANLQIDLLLAAGRIPAERAETLHRLRKHRNDIIHDLADSNDALVRECFGQAAELSGLPFPETTLRPRRALV